MTPLAEKMPEGGWHVPALAGKPTSNWPRARLDALLQLLAGVHFLPPGSALNLHITCSMTTESFFLHCCAFACVMHVACTACPMD